jgi:hypothetical protein
VASHGDSAAFQIIIRDRWHRREAALVVMGVPERKLLTPMRCAERVVDVEDFPLAGPYCRTSLIDESRREPRRLRLARRILQATDRRLRGQRRAALRTAPDRNLHQRVMPQPIQVDGILVAAGDRTDARHHHFEHGVPDAARFAPIRHRIGKPPAHPKPAFRAPQQQQTAVRGLVAAAKIHCEFLAPIALVGLSVLPLNCPGASIAFRTRPPKKGNLGR